MGREENMKKVAFPKWLRELDRFVTLKSQIFLYGNIYDCFYFADNYATASGAEELKWAKYRDVVALLKRYLRCEGYEVLCYYDQIDSFSMESTVPDLTRDSLVPFLREGDPVAGELLRDNMRLDGLVNLDEALNVFRYLVGNRKYLAAGILHFASRFSSDPNSLQNEERMRFLKLLKAAQEARVFPQRRDRRNVLILLCDKLSDIPAWLLVDNPLTKGVSLTRPGREERARFYSSRQRFFYAGDEPVRHEEVREALADLTEGFTNRELENLISISNREQLRISRPQAIVDLYKYGERENHWEKLDARKVAEAERELKTRVLGQDRAVDKCLDIIRRAKLGLQSIDSTRGNRPKGVLFFTGPTGTGKTELARSLAALIFNDEEAMIRFDMSEYNESNSGVKLIGAPPGYVGYDEGGHLTRRIRERPFSIVLFDEIEKAHPIIFDKFLQILDEGRLTDGKGETVYFGEALIIFTSNLGIFREDEAGKRVPNIDINVDSYDDMSTKILREVENFFSSRLNRPELLNRFGDNFVVFDFIHESTARAILSKSLRRIQQNLKEYRQCWLHFEDAFVDGFLHHYVMDNLENGGRGINNRVETHIKNGLANALFDLNRVEGVSLDLVLDEQEKDKCGKPAVRFLVQSQ